MKQEGKGVLLVTGASRGIGAATALLAGARGYAVGVNYRQDARAAEGVVRQIEQGGGRAMARERTPGSDSPPPAAATVRR